MEKLKTKLDIRAYKLTKYFLIFLWLLLVIQTGFFFHMIYNVEHLGWDLVEPATYLFQTIILLLGIFAFTKLHRNWMSGYKLIEDTSRNLSLRGYVKKNFNFQVYTQLKKEKEIITNVLNKIKY